MGDLGAGAFASVRTQTLKNGEEVAVKEIFEEYKYHDNYTHRFKKEVEMLEKLKGNPNIVPLLEVRINEDEHEYSYVMAKARCNLSEYMAENHEKLTDVERIYLFDQVVEAMVAAHSNNVLHRDLSPNNILIADKGLVWVADFGLGKDYDRRSMGGKSSMGGHGTQRYVAQEQLDKLRNATERSDVYSLGKIFYFILTGETPPLVIQSVEKFQTLIQRSTADDPEKRMKDAMEFKDEYEKSKQIHIILGQDDKKNQTLKELLDSNPNVSWEEFHESAMRCNTVDHDWYDFIAPAMNKLRDMNTIYDYVEHMGDAAVSFIKLFRERLEKMPGIGWPYADAPKVGNFAERFFYGSHINPSIQKEALELLWDWAAKEDRWAAQTTIISMIEGNKITKEELVDHLAHYMLEVDKTFLKLKSVRPILIKSPTLKRAVISLKSKLD